MSTFKENLIQARSAIVFLIGLTLAFLIVFSLEQWNPAPAVIDNATVSQVNKTVTLDEGLTATRAHRPLTETEMEWAKIAWRYFENNYVSETGMVNSADKYPASTMWDTASYMLGLIAAQRLELVSVEAFDERMSALLKTLAAMPLFDDTLPNKSYNTESVAMVTYTNVATERGLGWSAIDVGRIMVPLNVLVWHYPKHTQAVGEVLAHWDLDAIIKNAEMYGAAVDRAGKTIYLQEGRLGYEEYAAKSLVLVSKDVSRALDYELHTELIDIYGIEIAADARKPSEFGALNYVVSEPYVLDGVEFGWDRYSSALASRIFEVQKRRYEETGVLTAVSEDNIDEAPYFVYNTVFADGKAWNAITEDGEDASAFRSVSTKAAMGFHALFESEYYEKLIEHIGNNYNPERGWYSGVYEASGEPNKAITANTNGIILEALHYIAFGPMMSMQAGVSTQMAEHNEE